MRVEAESTSSHVAAIVAFEASGLRASSFRNKPLNAVTASIFKERFVCGHLGYCTTLLAQKVTVKVTVVLVLSLGQLSRNGMLKECTRAPPQFAAPCASSQP